MIDDSQLVQQLLESGLIDQTKLREGMRIREENGGSLYETLVLHEFVEESKIVRFVSRLLNVPFVDLTRVELEPAVTSLVPSSMAEQNGIIPIQMRNEGGQPQLVLGMVDPIDVMAMDEVATHTGVDIRPVLVGPAEIRDAIARVYSLESDSAPDMGDDLLDGLDELAADVLSDENWEDFFDSAEEVDETEDSVVISAEMKNRPTTDVFDAVDDVPSLDELELDDLNEPIGESHTSSSLSNLEDWDVDDAITSDEDATTSRRAEILSADAAESIFDDDEFPGQRASIESEVDEDPLDEEEEYLDEPTQKKSVEDLEAEMAEHDDEDEEPEDGETAVGVGPDETSSAGKAGAAYQTRDDDTSSLADEEDSNTGRTEAGMGARALANAVSGEKGHESGTDWGALGRQILKSGDEEDGEAEEDSARPSEEDEDSQDEQSQVDGSLSEDSALGETRSSEPKEDEPKEDEPKEDEPKEDEPKEDEPKEDEPKEDEAEDRTDAKSELSPESDPATREIAENDLRALTESPDERARHETAEYESVDLDNTGKTEIGIALQPATDEFALEEVTRASVDSLVDDPDETQTRSRSIVDLASQLDFELPEGVDERHLLLALVNLLVNQGVLTRDELLALAAALSETE